MLYNLTLEGTNVCVYVYTNINPGQMFTDI